MELFDDQYNLLRPARRAQWLVSVLAHHYGLDRGLENEIIVLATGLDQYLQEVFHHLDWRGEGTVSREEFRTLCGVLGLGPGMEECEGLLDNLPERLTFRHFHARLCGYFSSKAGGPRLPVGQENENIESRVRMRCPPMRKEIPRRTRRSGEQEEIQRLEDENYTLQEVLEDMRAALQSSDARCLALQVGLHRNMSSQGSGGLSATSNSRVLSQSYTVTTRCVQREVNVMRSSRDEQMEQVVKMNKDLEEELKKTQKVLVYLEEFNQRLLKEQVAMRRRAEEARQALSMCYGKVKNLEERSNQVSALQMRVDQLETELRHYRAEETIIHLVGKEQNTFSTRPRPPIAKPAAGYPARDAENLHSVDEQLFRSVEGRAASDEEEERWMREPTAKVQEMLTRVSSCCASGCEERRIRNLLPHLRSDGSDNRNTVILLAERVTKLTEELTLKERELKDMEVLMEEMKLPFMEEAGRKAEEAELLRMDLQMLETERVRLSLIEEKLLDVLHLLQELRNLEISEQEVGGAILTTLEICREPQQGRDHILEILDTLRQELSVCELRPPREESTDSKTPSLVFSC